MSFREFEGPGILEVSFSSFIGYRLGNFCSIVNLGICEVSSGEFKLSRS